MKIDTTVGRELLSLVHTQDPTSESRVVEIIEDSPQDAALAILFLAATASSLIRMTPGLSIERYFALLAMAEDLEFPDHL